MNSSDISDCLMTWSLLGSQGLYATVAANQGSAEPTTGRRRSPERFWPVYSGRFFIRTLEMDQSSGRWKVLSDNHADVIRRKRTTEIDL